MTTTTVQKLRIVIADDHAMIRQGVRSTIESSPGWKCCGEADNGKAAIELIKRTNPDIAILDITMPVLNGLDATRILKSECPKTKILILTMHDSESTAEEVREAGANGYLLKSDASELLPKAIAALALGKSFLTPKISKKQNGDASPKSGQTGSYKFRLTPREREIVQLLAEGKSNKDVGELLGISTGTVETHRKNICGKLEFHCTADLVRYAIRNKLTPP